MTGAVLAASGGALGVVMVSLWLVSLAISDASIVDIAWGPLFVVVAWVTVVAGDTPGLRPVLLAVLVTLWGLRLGIHLALRNLGHGEDPRYRAMRRRWGDRFWWVSLVTVFGLQGVLAWVVSLPVQLAGAGTTEHPIGPLAVVGVVTALVGLGFEVVGDAQLTRFKADPANKGRVLDRGLWRYTRHPNYFGDAVLWWGLFLIAAGAPLARWGVIGPVLMTVLLVRVSGVAMLERSITDRRPDYADYIRRTPAFIPRPPKP